MRPLCAAYGVLAVAIVACGSQDTNTIADGGGTDATTDTFASLDALPLLDSQTCSGDASQCLFGNAQVLPSDAAAAQFGVTPASLRARLFRQFPSTGISPTDQQIVGRDHSWAFSGLDAWAHYYVEFDPGFPEDAGVTETVATVIGPLAVPGAGASINVSVKPVQLNVFEASSQGATNQLEGATARLVEATDGTSSVSLLVGGNERAMMYDPAAHAYTVEFMQTPSTPLPAAQPTYRITSSASGSPDEWQLVADAPTFTGTITQPSAGAILPAGGAICVAWSREPADYVTVELFKRDTSNSWVSVYNSSLPKLADVAPTSSCDGGGATAETIPGTLGAGSYLLNVSFTKANCPATADGCVHSSTVANELFTVQ
jgi:hypothetical protein